LAEQSEKDGLEFPVFKSGAGAFDRAKYNQQSSEMVSDGSLTGKTIDKELMDQKRSIDKVITSAVKFYRDSFNNNIKEIDPSIDKNSIYYKEAYSDANADISEIKIKLEDGETIDGKEIFDMSSNSVKNKLTNVNILKNGRVTEIVENLGLKKIKDFDEYDQIRSDFDSKTNNENIKFDDFLGKFSKILEYFNEEGPMSAQNSSILYTPENNAIISALAKILEAEGFTNESIVNMSEKYEDNLKKLNEKNKDKKAEDTIKKDEDQPQNEEGAVQTEEQKLEEKKLDEPIPIASASESSTTTTENNKTEESPVLSQEQNTIGTKLEERVNTAQQPQENRSSVDKAQDDLLSMLGIKLPGAGKNDSRIEGSEPVSVSDTKKTPEQENRSSVDKAQDDLLSMLGIKLPGAGKNETIQGDSKNTEEVSTLGSVQDKMLEDLGFIKPKVPEKTTSAVSDIIGSTPKKETTTTKMLEKKEDIVKSMNETFPVNSPIKETEIQNLSSVSTPEPIANNKNTQTENIQNTNTPTNPNQITNTESGENKVESINNPPVKENNQVDNKVSEENEKMNKEMANNIKTMVNLLGQLNNTLQSPLIVIPNDKKFG
jgi:hypothetical protein